MNKTIVAHQAKTSGSLPSTHGILQRKCACGNHTVAGGECGCAQKKSGLQRKLTIGASNDPLEREADRVADQVMAAPAHSAVSGAPPRIQRYAGQATAGSDTAPASVDRVLASSGRPLEPALQQDMEQRFGHDFSRVRVHSGGAAEQSAREVNAHAYTVGHNIVFGAGRFAPGTHEGRRLIAHELTHVVQQNSINQNGPSVQGPMIQRQPAGSSEPAGEPGNRPNLDVGDAGPGVSLLQRLLGVRTTGVFDEPTRRAVVAFQQARPELHPATGGVGPKTWKALDEKAAISAGTVPPEASIEVTNHPTLTSARLKAMGYRFKDNFGGVPKWVHPSGKELWLQSPSKATSPLPPSPPDIAPKTKLPTHPDVQGAREWGDNLEARRNELWEEAKQILQTRTPDGVVTMPDNEYYKKLNRFHRDLTSVLEEEAPMWQASGLTNEEEKELETQLERIKKLGDYPPEMEDLGTP